MSLRITESFTTLSLPESPTVYQTYYKKVEADESNGKSSTALPLVILHGGPLLGHDYCLPLQQLARELDISAVIFYDQLGCGKSTHLSADDTRFSIGFWDINIRQLKSFLDDLGLTTTGFYLFGHSMGSLLGLAYAATHLEGLKALIVANALISFADVRRANLRLLKDFPSTVADAIISFEEFCLGERKETSVSYGQYLAASDEFRSQHFDRKPPPSTQHFNKSIENVMEVMDVFASV